MRPLGPLPREEIPLIRGIRAVSEKVHVHRRKLFPQIGRIENVQHFKRVFGDGDVARVRVPFFEAVEGVAVAKLLSEKGAAWHWRKSLVPLFENVTVEQGSASAMSGASTPPL